MLIDRIGVCPEFSPQLSYGNDINISIIHSIRWTVVDTTTSTYGLKQTIFRVIYHKYPEQSDIYLGLFNSSCRHKHSWHSRCFVVRCVVQQKKRSSMGMPVRLKLGPNENIQLFHKMFISLSSLHIIWIGPIYWCYWCLYCRFVWMKC